MPLPPPVTATVLPSRNLTTPPPRFASNIQPAISRPESASHKAELGRELPAPDLSRARARELRHAVDVLRDLVGRELRARVREQLVRVDLTDDRDADALTPSLVIHAEHG